MGLNNDIEELKKRADSDYQEYQDGISAKRKEYNDRRSEFDVLIGTINNERLSFRKEIKELYDFLQSIGGSLKGRISVYDFADEAPAPNQDYREIHGMQKPDFKKTEAYELLWKGWLAPVLDHRKNKKMYEEFLRDVENRKIEYAKDIQEKAIRISHLKDAIEIARIYRNTIVYVKDIIREKILPELGLIQAFLYADGIREVILDGDSPESIKPCGISEYKGTKQDIHYQFVENTFDFYEISTAFFKHAILTNILKDGIVTDEEKQQFEYQVDRIKDQGAYVKRMAMIKNETDRS